jgi:ribosomal protein S18 acetylase RimI-like enzyme
MLLKLKDVSIKLRPFLEKDIEFLKKVYFGTREEELKRVSDWNQEMKMSFLTQQFNAQHVYYQKNYIGAHFFIIEKDNKKSGRLYYTEDFAGGIRIIDIAILPEFQKKGIGNEILSSILERAIELGKNVTIHVESFNPVMNWYKKLGFEKISETNGVYHLLQWNHKN